MWHDRRVGDVLDGRFELLGFAGAGGMGAVYRALDRATGRVVALKLVDPLGDDDAARIAREAELLSAIDHPGVVRCVDHGVSGEGARYIAMEWVTGLDLESWLVRGKLAPEQAVAIARRVGEALAAVHARGVVHRDIKPANLILVDDRVDAIKLVDFGIASDADELERSDPGIVIGTPEYMAPEALRGDPVDARADVYGLGAVLFRALAGRPVFTGAQRLAVLAKVLLEVPPPICDLRPDVPIEFEELLGRMLAKDPARRPADGAAVVAALAEVEAAGPVGQTPRKRPAITFGEQRVTCIVLCGRRAQGDITVRIKRSDLAKPSPEHTEIERIAIAAGGVLEVLPNGSLLIHLDSGGPAERATRAASCALAVAELRPRTSIVVATGQVVKSGTSAVGQVIDRAAAELATAPEGVWIDPTTAALLDQRFDVDDADVEAIDLTTSGNWRVHEPWKHLTGERDTIAPVRMFMGKPSACVGRAAELTTLQAVLDDAWTAPRARVVLLTAPPGVGKSRLVRELLAKARDATVIGARGELVRAGAPFALASSLVAHATGDKLRDVHSLLAEPALIAARADPAVMADAIRSAWCEWIAGVVKRPTVMVVEDLHWGDLPSLRLIDAALGELSAQPFVVVATARPAVRDTFPNLWASRDVWELRLGPLSRAAAEQLIRGALGDVPASTVDALIARSAGHPFHLEEMVRAVASGAGPGALPETVLGMVQARLDVLDADARRVLRAASVFGNELTVDGVASLVDGADPHLAALADQEILTRTPTGLAFRHALVRDAVYATLPDTDRVVAHRAAGVWLESTGRADAAVLAEHFEAGGAPQRAERQFRRAAEQALDGEDHVRAAGFVERALRCGPDEVEQGHLFAIEAEIAVWRGDFDRAAERALAGADRVEPGSAAWFSTVSQAITAFGQRGQNARVAEQLDRVAAAGADEAARGACATALCRGLTQLSWAHYRGDLSKPRRRIDALAREKLEPYHAGWIHRARAESAWLHGHDVDRCLHTLDAAIDAFSAARALRPLCLTRLNSASLAGWSGATALGDKLVADGLADAARLGSGFLARYGRVVQAVLAAYAGDPRAATSLRAALPEAAGNPRLSCLVRVYLGWLADAAGDSETATAEATAALTLPVVAELRAAVLALQSTVMRRRGEDAVAVAEEAVALGASTDLELTDGFAAVALAEAFTARGDRDASRNALALAHDKLLAIAATIADPAQRQAFLHRPLPNARIMELAQGSANL